MVAHLKAKVSSLENIYLAIALASGLLMAAFNPPFTGVPDEKSHFWKAWAVAEGNLTCEPGDTIPKCAYKLGNAFPVYADVPGVGRRVLFGKTLKKFLDRDDYAPRAGDAYAVCSAPPLGYLPQAAGLRIAAWLGWSSLAGLFTARVLNLVASAMLVYGAIRVAPFGKIVFLVVGLLPITIQQFASLGYDAVHIGASFLFIACLLRLAVGNPRPLRAGDVAALLLLGLFVSLGKYGYLGLTLLVFLLPVSAFRDRRRYWLFSLGFVAFNVLAFYLVYRYFQAHLSPLVGPGLPKVSPVRQFETVVGSPLAFLTALINSLYYQATYYFETFLFKPGWLQVSLPPLWYLLMAAGMAVLVRSEAEEAPLSLRQRRILLAVFLLNATAIFFTMYVSWTPVGAGLIEGVQGRYFLNLFPLLVLSCYKSGARPARGGVTGTRAFLVLFYLAMIGWAFLELYGIYYDKEPDVSLLVKLHGKLFGGR